MCKCNTVTRDDIPFAIWSGLRPDTPHQCVRAQCGFRFFRFLAHSLTTFGRWGCGERINLSHVVGNFIVVLLEMSRLVAPETRSQTLRRTKRVLKCPSGHGRRENAYRGSQEVRRAEARAPAGCGRHRNYGTAPRALPSPTARDW